jgi:hypothetical protein
MWSEVVMAIFKVISQHLPVGAEENHKKTTKTIGVLTKIKSSTL